MRSEVRVFPGPPLSKERSDGLLFCASQCGAYEAGRAPGGVCIVLLGQTKKKGDEFSDWGCSSVGRAIALQAIGHRFDPVHLHQEIRKRRSIPC